jgi:hypothetical protein
MDYGICYRLNVRSWEFHVVYDLLTRHEEELLFSFVLHSKGVRSVCQSLELGTPSWKSAVA